MNKKILLFLAVLLILSSSVYNVFAQTPDPRQSYIVQAGDTLGTIAYQFGVSVTDLINENNLSDPNNLQVGWVLYIPGTSSSPAFSGTLASQPIPLGETLSSLTHKYQIPQETLIKLNRISSPSEVIAGSKLLLPENMGDLVLTGQLLLTPEETGLEAAVRSGQNPWTLSIMNDYAAPWQMTPGEPLYYPDTENTDSLSPLIQSIQLSPLPLVQGKTTTIQIQASQPVTITGSLADHSLAFFPYGNENQYIALQGVNVMAPPGAYPLSIKVEGKDGSVFEFNQMIILSSGNYWQEKLVNIDPATLDPAITKPEEDLITSLISTVSADKYWDGVFKSPATYYEFTSWFGTRRSYNDGPYDRFHGGVDFAGGMGLPVFAPAPGVVVFAGPLSVRGNATFIYHGWGVYTGYFHQSEIKVKVGDRVETGQTIGLVGNTGRVQSAGAYEGAGAHLHWEVWVNGYQVDPLEWLETPFP